MNKSILGDWTIIQKRSLVEIFHKGKKLDHVHYAEVVYNSRNIPVLNLEILLPDEKSL